jgi:hypothetical protein
VTRTNLREYAAVQRERYLLARRADKGRLLDEVVAVTGIHRKAAILSFAKTPSGGQVVDLSALFRRQSQLDDHHPPPTFLTSLARR